MTSGDNVLHDRSFGDLGIYYHSPIEIDETKMRPIKPFAVSLWLIGIWLKACYVATDFKNPKNNSSSGVETE
jgi:hypothetical protein